MAIAVRHLLKSLLERTLTGCCFFKPPNQLGVHIWCPKQALFFEFDPHQRNVNRLIGAIDQVLTPSRKQPPASFCVMGVQSNNRVPGSLPAHCQIDGA